MIAQTAHFDREERERHMNFTRHCFQWLRDSRCFQFSSYGNFEEKENSQSEVGAEDRPEDHLREALERGT